MQRLQAYKFELRPNGEQERNMHRFAGACRFVYNKALVLQQENREAGGKFIRYFAMARYLTEWRNSTETPWLGECVCDLQQQALRDLDRAYNNFFNKRSDFPRLKKKGQSTSFRFPDKRAISLDNINARIKLPKLGWLRFRKSRDVVGEVRNVTISKSCGKWFASILTERAVEKRTPQGGSVGIDVGISRFATMSDGSFIEPLNSFRKHEDRLRRYQRSMSRKTKFSSNWRKAKEKVQKIHARIANSRRDFLHKASATISKNHAIVAVEDLKVGNMSRSAKGSLNANGRNVRAKSGLNKSILDQGWREFRRQLSYKVALEGGCLVAVNPQFTSQTCPCCGRISKSNRQTQAKFKCVDCGFEENADLVGAINILARGHRVLACGETAQEGLSMKQEPTEATLAVSA